jgi:hypothetical protein
MLKQVWSILDLVRPPSEKKLPVVLGPEEVRQILGAIRRKQFCVCLTTTYPCGLLLREGTHLRVRDIGIARMMIQVRSGKGLNRIYIKRKRAR